MHTSSLITNLKGPKRVYDLGEKTLIVGDNEAGKSAITQSIQLALRGSAIGLLFRDEVKLGAALNTMAGDPNGLDIAAVQNTGEVFSYRLPVGKKADHKGPNRSVNLDSRDIREAFSGSIDRIYKLLASLMGDAAWQAAYEDVAATEQQAKDATAAAKRAEDIINRQGNPDTVTIETLTQKVESFGFTSVLRRLAADAKSAGDAERVRLLNIVGALYGKDAFTTKQVFIDDIVADSKSFHAWADINEHRRARDAAEMIAAVRKQEAATKSRTLDAMSAQLVATFESRVAPFLYPGEALSIDRNTGYAYLVRNGKRYAALSGSTEARVLAAFAAALATPGVPGVVVLDDRMWSVDNLIATMTALAGAPVQVIITSTIGVSVPGWATVYV